MIVSYTTAERDLLARLMRAEAIGEGELGMIMVGNVVTNRVLYDCLTFKNIKSIYNAIYQPNQFSGINSSLFRASPTTKEKYLANRALKGEYHFPATNALWFYAPGKDTECKDTFYDQPYVGKYKNHCFYTPNSSDCKK